jgi:hypothetical protein
MTKLIVYTNRDPIEIQVADNKLNDKTLSLFRDAKRMGMDIFQQLEQDGYGREITDYSDDAVEERAQSMNDIRSAFKEIGQESPINLDGELSIYDCNVLHRCFTTAFFTGDITAAPPTDSWNDIKLNNQKYKWHRKKDTGKNVLQKINFGVHRYESTIKTARHIARGDLSRAIKSIIPNIQNTMCIWDMKQE